MGDRELGIAVLLVGNAEFKADFEKEAEELGIIVALGGAQRWQSVQNGINTLPKNITHVLVHDAARPFIDQDIITETIKTLSQHENFGCLVAKPVFDTVKIVSDGFVKDTVERNSVFLAQTPQGAPVSLLKELYAKMPNFPDLES